MTLERNLRFNSAGRSPERAKVKECVEFHPQKDGIEIEVSKNRAIVFLPGWKMGARHANVVSICQSFADNAESSVYAMTSQSMERAAPGDGGGINPIYDKARAMGREPDFLYEEARAIAARVKELGLKEVTIAGHSQGGGKAIDLAVLLQNDPEITVRGIILFNPVGIDERDPLGLTIDFIANGSNISPGAESTAGEKLKAKARMLLAGSNVARNIGADIMSSGTTYPRRLASEVREMAQANPHMEEVKVPVVLVLGKNDPVANPNEEGAALLDRLAAEGKMTDKPVTIWGEEGSEIVGGSGKVLRGQDARAYVERILHFRNSPSINVLRTAEFGSHALPLLRPHQVTKTALNAIDRYYRTQEKA